jgi:hypothetical protein
MYAKRPEGPALSGQRPPLPARAMSAQVKLADPVYPIYLVRRADRGPTPITRLVHLPPPVAPLQDPDSRSYTILIAHHVNLLSRLGRPCGHQAPPPGPELVCGAGRYHRTGRRSAPATDSAGSRAGRTHAGTTRVSPSLIQSGRPPARYRPCPLARRCCTRGRMASRMPDAAHEGADEASAKP